MNNHCIIEHLDEKSIGGVTFELAHLHLKDVNTFRVGRMTSKRFGLVHTIFESGKEEEARSYFRDLKPV